MNRFARNWLMLFGATGLLLGSGPSHAEQLYNPIEISDEPEVVDRLTADDIPTGDGGFARDYLVSFERGNQVSIDVVSEDFDTVIVLIARDGTTIAQNDDGPDGTTNSLLFTRIDESGEYIVRVRAFGETGGGEFTLRVVRLVPVQD
ncbi:hypothetical protein KR51_00007820 [Rubidibacter lacunae KORDI 51-2]|uniref:Peptidase C-terminal archaeal/bacterial domain-containing protein n=1 Tax=Rubidibacter lacunae KORDI 51-2 TaxID=582515 RepID=U5DNM7_9CHRO|nr:PPC domain-containing protein [Rubidibacter lacunae]ERN42472.1 hypothetical protein KR51_00007820 [Rubidibacter lacunae KORDI 51-2]